MEKEKIVLMVAPTGKGRPRITKQGRAFTPAKTRNKEAEVRYWLHQEAKIHFGDKPLKATIDFFFLKPKSVSLKKRPFPTVKPDIDNMIKLILDSANGILYDDDKQIIDCRARKHYGDPERVEILIEEIS